MWVIEYFRSSKQWALWRENEKKWRKIPMSLMVTGNHWQWFQVAPSVVCPSILSIYLPISAYFPQKLGSYCPIFVTETLALFTDGLRGQNPEYWAGQASTSLLSLFILANRLHMCSHLYASAICMHHVYILYKCNITQRVYRSGLSKLSRLADIMTILLAKCSNFQVQLTSILLKL